MREEIRQKTIDYKAFISDDGIEFNTKKECIHHEKILKGERKTCPICNGRGEIAEETMEENYHIGAPCKLTRWRYCLNCHGKGYLEKKIVWE